MTAHDWVTIIVAVIGFASLHWHSGPPGRKNDGR